jgi:hypothetical protein
MRFQVAVPTLPFRVAGMDKWFFRPALISVFALTIAWLICGIPGILGFILWPASLLGFPVAAVVLLILAALSFWRRCPRKGASYLLAIALPVALFRPIIWTSEVIHVGLSAWLGVGHLSTYKAADGKFAGYDWSVGLVTNPDTFLIYDATDEILLPLIQHARLKVSESQYVEMCSGQGDNHTISHLIGHYYICTWE